MSKAKKILCALCLPFPYTAFAKSGSVNYSWGADALATMHDFVVTMMLYVQYICCAIAGVYVIVSVCQIYIKMNTGEDGITKSIMTLVGACLFLIGAFYVSRFSSATAYNLTCIRSQTNKVFTKKVNVCFRKPNNCAARHSDSSTESLPK